MSLLMWLLAWLSGAGAVDRLGAPEWRTREAAEAALVRAWPLSRPALLGAMRSEDPEVRRRAVSADAAGARRVFGRRDRVVRGLLERRADWGRTVWLLGVQPDLVRWDMVDFALADRTGKRMLALWLLTAPFEEDDGMPWAPTAVHRAYAGDRALVAAFGELLDHTWSNADGTAIVIYAGEEPGGYIFGLNEARFWLRRLPDPVDYEWTDVPMGKWPDARRKWAAEREPGLAVPDPPKP
jgi:hypothetical protein